MCPLNISGIFVSPMPKQKDENLCIVLQFLYEISKEAVYYSHMDCHLNCH